MLHWRLSRSTRWLGYAIVGILGMLQVLLFQKIQSIETQLNAAAQQGPLPLIPNQNDGAMMAPLVEQVGGDNALLVEKRTTTTISKSINNNGGTTTTTTRKGVHEHQVGDQSASYAAKTHTMPNGHKLPVALQETEIKTLATLRKPFCLPWHVSSDAWWTDHVLWEVYHEDDTHYCFRRILNKEKVNTIRAIQKNQFRNDCSHPIYKKMWNSGFSNDLRNLVDGLKHSTEVTHRPFQVAMQPWHYASPKPFNISTAACGSQDMFCYFLPLSNCPQVPVNDTIKQVGFLDRLRVWGPRLFDRPTRWYLEYVSRPQTWLRHRVYQFVQKQNVVAPCTALHVRRGDVISHGSHARRYFSIAEYLNTTQEIEHNILLLTDDHNAIGEALHEFPDRNWMYIDRPRYRGNEGGFERHLPSNDPILEMTVLLSTFQLVRRCTSMVRSSSAFGDYLWGEIKDEHAGDETIWWKRVDENLGEQLFSENNIAISANVSKAYDIVNAK